MKRMIIMLLVATALSLHGTEAQWMRRHKSEAFAQIDRDIQEKNLKGITSLLNDRPSAIMILSPNSKATLLIKAVQHRSFDVAQLLIMRGVDIDAQDNQGQTALMYAVSLGYPEFVELLLQQKADTSKKDVNNDTVFTLDPGAALTLRKTDPDKIKTQQLLHDYKQQEEKAGACPE